MGSKEEQLTALKKQYQELTKRGTQLGSLPITGEDKELKKLSEMRDLIVESYKQILQEQNGAGDHLSVEDAINYYEAIIETLNKFIGQYDLTTQQMQDRRVAAQQEKEAYKNSTEALKKARADAKKYCDEYFTLEAIPVKIESSLKELNAMVASLQQGTDNLLTHERLFYVERNKDYIAKMEALKKNIDKSVKEYVEVQEDSLKRINELFPERADSHKLINPTDRVNITLASSLRSLQQEMHALGQEITSSIDNMLSNEDFPQWRLGQEPLFSNLEEYYKALKEDHLPNLTILFRLVTSMKQAQKIISPHQTAKEIAGNFNKFIEVANDKSMEEKGIIFSLIKQYLSPEVSVEFITRIENALVTSPFDKEALDVVEIFIKQYLPGEELKSAPTKFDVDMVLKRIEFIKKFKGENYADFLSNIKAMDAGIMLARAGLGDLVTADNLQNPSFIEKVAILTNSLNGDDLLNIDNLTQLSSDLYNTMSSLNNRGICLDQNLIDQLKQSQSLHDMVNLLLQKAEILSSGTLRQFIGHFKDKDSELILRVGRLMSTISLMSEIYDGSERAAEPLESSLYQLEYNERILREFPGTATPEFEQNLQLLAKRNEDTVLILSQIADSLARVQKFVEKYQDTGSYVQVENFKNKVIPILLSPGSLTALENKQALGKLAREVFTHDTVSSQLIDDLLRCLDGILNCFRKVTTVISSAPTEGAAFSFFHYYNKPRLQQEIERELGINLDLNSNSPPPNPKN